MAKPDDTSKARPGRNSDAVLIEAIEEERTRLMQAESLLDCVLAAIDEDEVDAQGPYLPNVIELARELVHKALDQLDSLKLRPLIDELQRLKSYPISEEKLTLGFSDDPDQVKEPSIVYLAR